MSLGLNYQFVLVNAMGMALGEVCRNRGAEITSSLSFVEDDLRPYLSIRIGVPAPAYPRVANSRLIMEVRLYATNILDIHVKKVTDVSEVSAMVAATHHFEQFLNSDLGIYEVSFQMEIQGLTTSNIFHILPMEIFFNEDGHFESKPNVAAAVTFVREMFNQNGKVKLYVREEYESVTTKVANPKEHFAYERAHGRKIRRFYGPAFQSKDCILIFHTSSMRQNAQM